jgi:hypothetical protein
MLVTKIRISDTDKHFVGYEHKVKTSVLKGEFREKVRPVQEFINLYNSFKKEVIDYGRVNCDEKEVKIKQIAITYKTDNGFDKPNKIKFNYQTLFDDESMTYVNCVSPSIVLDYETKGDGIQAISFKTQEQYERVIKLIKMAENYVHGEYDNNGQLELPLDGSEVKPTEDDVVNAIEENVTTTSEPVKLSDDAAGNVVASITSGKKTKKGKE